MDGQVKEYADALAMQIILYCDMFSFLLCSCHFSRIGLEVLNCLKIPGAADQGEGGHAPGSGGMCLFTCHQAHCAGSFHPCVAFSACFCSLFHYANWYLLYFILAYLFVNVALMYFPHSLLSLSLRFSMFSVGLTVLMLNIVISGLRRLPQHTHSNSN